MDKFQGKYRIASARVAWHCYDGGAYFVTVCTAGKAHHFGEIDNGGMLLSMAGIIANDCFAQAHVHYPYAEIPLFTIMPNHVHAIVFIDGNYNNDGNSGNGGGCICRDAINRVSTTSLSQPLKIPRNPMACRSLGTVVRGLKARISHAAHQNGIPFGWQARFYDRIIRNHLEMNRIAEYIVNNVAMWNLDELNDS